MSNVVEDSPLLYFQIQNLPLQIRCAVCSVKCNNVIDDTENPSEDIDNSCDDRKPTLEALCSILKVSNMCEIIGNANKKSVKDFPQEKLFCSVCYKRILEGLKIRKNIEMLQVELTDIITNLKSSIISSYEKQEKENLGETDLEMFVRMLRHTLSQCWATVKVQLNPLLSSKKRRPRTPCRRKTREFVSTNTPLIGPILFKQECAEVVETHPQTVSLADDFEEATEVESHAHYVDDKVANAIAEPDEDIILEHDLRTSKVKVGSFQCTLCYKIFCREVNLKIHQTRKHGRMTGPSPKSDNQLNKFKCAYCEKMLPESESTLAEKNKSMFKCEVPGCKQIVATYDHLKSHHQRTCPQRHLLPGRMKQNALYRCDPCSKSFETVTAYKHHQLSIHEKKFKYFCEICGHGTQAQSMLIRHKLVHSNEKTVQCEECNYICKRPSQLMYHRRIHRNEYPYLCQVCGKTFRLNNKLQQHMASHAASKEFRCHLCGKFFASKTYVTNHINSFHNKKFLKQPATLTTTTKNYFAKTVTEEHSDKHSKMVEKEKETTGCEDAQSNRMKSNSSTTIDLHIDEGIVENVSENHTI